MQGGNWKVATDALHLVPLAAMFLFGIVACILYFRVTSRLESVGEPVPGVLERKDVFRVFRRYRELANRYSWSMWLYHGYWIALFFALLSGIAYIYWRR